jgi:hypothetical protein
MSYCNFLDHVVAFLIAYSKNILIYFKLFIGWPKIGTCWDIENSGYSTWTSSAIG